MKTNTKQCVILAGGFGTRLGNLTKKTPKPLLEFQNKPFLFYLMHSLKQQGIEQFLILTFYKSHLFKDKIFKDFNVKILKEKTKLGTGGGIINFKKYLKSSFFVVNGDTFFNINLKDFEKEVFKNKSNIGVALTKNLTQINNLNYSISKQNIVKKLSIVKKPKLVSGGIYLVRKKIISKIKEKNELDLDHDIIKTLLIDTAVTAKYYNQKFIDIGSIKSYEFLKKNFLNFYYRKCCFLDRDGVINEDYGYVHQIKKFKWKKNVLKAIKYLNDKKFLVIIITNQAGIAKAIFNMKKYLRLKKYYLNKISSYGAKIDAVYECFDHPEGKIKKYTKKSFMRKPSPGMILKACDDFYINKKKSFFIGDKISDKGAAIRAGVKFYYVEENILSQIKRIIK